MKKVKHSILKHTSGLTKLLISVTISLVFSFLLKSFDIENKCRIILSWDVFCLLMMAFSWTLFFATNERELCDVVAVQDEGLKMIFTIVLVALCVSVFAAVLLLTNQAESNMGKFGYLALRLSPVLFSWLLLHTIFTIRYAHLYHDHNSLATGSNVGGITFPSKSQPDYVDFAYFSFVIGMTFQVSDVQVNSRAIRRFVLMHSLLSFLFNTIIVALTINALAGMNN
ncbi:DUF1345 domain-containing protein [Sediminibacterium ginsengisoli]|uniref:Uncharacterized membrane protein n=1 Tax=Sediminibacterium ginsengisoli TaxID=413434 RepID=A0A1T4P2B9_9BACT|nr:DUF1345 domain-containing protein [Sediminibacterium ginsengisoli]SJZ85633.1 Uncharacterized membrane protein [Sediminibacterium ginsengisoli]